MPSVLTLNSDGVNSSFQPLPSQSNTSSPVDIATQLTKFRLAAAQAKLKTKNVRILFPGDSYFAGNGSKYSSTGGQYIGSLTNHLGLSSPTTPSYLSLITWPNTTDNRVDVNGQPVTAQVNFGWYGYAGGLGFGGAGTYFGNAPAGPLRFTPGPLSGPCNLFDVYYLISNGCGTFTAQATDGPVSAVVQTNGSPSVGVLRGVTAGTNGTTNSLSITNITGTVLIVGVEAYSTDLGRILIANASVNSSSASGNGAESWTNDQGIGGLSMIKAYAPDLSIIDLGGNDAAEYQSTKAVYKVAMQQMIAACSISGSVILAPPAPFNDANINMLMYQYIDAMYELSTENNIPILDAWRGRYQNIYQGPDWMADQYHGKDEMYVDHGAYLGGAINAVVRF